MLALEFDVFWKSYPLRIGRLAAMKAYKKAREMATAEVILAGVTRYVQNKPLWQSWAHPASWLNQGRWMDESDRLVHPCPHDPPCLTTWACGRKQQCALGKSDAETPTRPSS